MLISVLFSAVREPVKGLEDLRMLQHLTYSTPPFRASLQRKHVADDRSENRFPLFGRSLRLEFP